MDWKGVRLLASAGIGWMFDAMDVLLLSYILVAAAGELGLGKGEAGLVILANNVGMLLGALLFGRLADVWGRKPVFMTTLAIYGAGTGLTALAGSASDLALLRFFTGLGLGGELPVAASLMSELSPTRYRGRNVVLLESFWSLGSILAAAVAYFAFPRLGWRIPLALLSLTALYVLVLRSAVPESPLWLYLRDPQRAYAIAQTYGVTLDRVERHSARELLTGYRSQTLLLWAAWLLLAFGYYGAFLWLPTMIAKRGLGLVATFEYSLIMSLAQLPGYFTAAYLIERIGRRPSLLLFFLGSAASAIAFAAAPNVGWLLASGIALNFFNLGAWGLIYAYTPESFPSDLRATGMGSSGSMARVGMIIGPLLPTYLTFSTALAAYAAAWLTAGVSIYLFGKETKTIKIE
ncbi:MAG: MFS transporter [Thermoproteus sp.]